MNKLIIDIQPEHLNLMDIEESEAQNEVIQALAEAIDKSNNQESAQQKVKPR